jgi:hypothetical protein
MTMPTGHSLNLWNRPPGPVLYAKARFREVLSARGGFGPDWVEFNAGRWQGLPAAGGLAGAPVPFRCCPVC